MDFMRYGRGNSLRKMGMTDANVQIRKPLHPVLTALLVGALSVLSHIPLLWVIDNSYRDPARVFEKEIDLSAFKDWDPIWLYSLLGAATACCFLVGATGTPSRARRLSSQIAAAVCFAASILNFLFAAEDLNWLKLPSSFPFGEAILVVLGMAVLLCLIPWILVTRKWSDADVFKYGLRYSANAAMAVLLLSIPGHIVANGYSGFLSGLGTFIAIYFSIEVLIVTATCGLWVRRYMPASVPRDMHAAWVWIALRESVMLASAAFFLFILAYAMHGFAYRERFTLALMGQIGFCVLGSCAAARGIAGYLMRESRPFWFLGLYLLLADLVVVVAWKLILPRVF